eukprot:GEMP01029059.1.p1 GENE.GEMP01029059.1~~GEMP01029059.1.p1  ORF type:complete len:260 (+),score=59.72 GEMP01029059.1:442-1221(+)
MIQSFGCGPLCRGGKKFKRATSLCSTDVQSYLAAESSGNLHTLVKLLPSNKPIEIAFQHPWAHAPETVGTLAAMKICMFLGDEDDPGLRGRLRTLGAVKMFVDFLTGPLDRVHSGLLALSYLSADGDDPHPKICAELYELKALPTLVGLVNSVETQGARLAAADICFMMCVAREEYRDEFVSIGGLKQFVFGIDGVDDSALVFIDYLDEIMRTADGKFSQKLVKIVVDAGIKSRLEGYVGASEEVAEAATRVLVGINIV